MVSNASANRKKDQLHLSTLRNDYRDDDGSEGRIEDSDGQARAGGKRQLTRNYSDNPRSGPDPDLSHRYFAHNFSSRIDRG